MSFPGRPLPYDTDDPSVILRTPLTSLASITAVGGEDLSVGSNIFDADLGMKPAGTIPGVRFRHDVIAALTGKTAGQVSFDIQRQAMCNNAGDVGTLPGYAGAAFRLYCIGLNATNRIDINVAGSTSNSIDHYGYNSSQNGYRFVRTAESDEWMRITISVAGHNIDFYADGVRYAHIQRTGGILTGFEDHYLGSFYGTASNAWPYYVRNLLIASRPVPLVTIPVMQKLAFIGDSLVGAYSGRSGTPIGVSGNIQNLTSYPERGDHVLHFQCAKVLAPHDIQVNQLALYSSGAASVLNAGTYPSGTIASGDALKTDVDGANTTRATAILASQPSCICMIVSGNGVPALLPYDGTAESTYDAALREHVEAWMGVGSFASGRYSEAKLMVLGLPYYSSQAASAIDFVRARMATVPAWWDATYPTRAGRVVTVDLAEVMGGSTTPSDYLIDGLHPGPIGYKKCGEAFGRAILDAIAAGVS